MSDISTERLQDSIRPLPKSGPGGAEGKWGGPPSSQGNTGFPWFGAGAASPGCSHGLAGTKFRSTFATRLLQSGLDLRTVVGIELRRASCRWRVTVVALSIARRVHISTMAAFPE